MKIDIFPKERRWFLYLGILLIITGIYGMWDYLPEALLYGRSWEAKDSLVSKMLFGLGCLSVFTSLNKKYTRNIFNR